MNTSHAPGPRERTNTPEYEVRQATSWFIRYIADRARRGIPEHGKKVAA